jgi:hypothetical protein
MKCNVGRKERVARTFLGLVILGAGIILESWWGVLGFIPIATAAIGWCPLSALLGISTCRESASLPTDTTAGGSHQPLRARDMDPEERKRPH